MIAMSRFQAPRGTRDFLPQEMIRRQLVLDKLRGVFEKWSFDPLETPAFEDWSLLAAKSGGGEAIRDEIYYFRDKSNRELGLRFDLTVPLARVVANNQNLPKPFRRYQIGRVWRYDRPGTGRYREFWQADADVIGVAGPQADADVLALACCALKSLGIADFRIRLSSRRLVESFLRNLGVKDVGAVFRSIDKLEKIGGKAVEKELEEKGLQKSRIEEIMRFIRLKDVASIDSAAQDKAALEEIKGILALLGEYGCSRYAEIDMSLVRGLDYYTASVFEVSCSGMSIGGGGRYDRLIELFGGKPTPAVGISFGVERILEIMEARNLFDDTKTVTKVFVAGIRAGRKEIIGIADGLRETGIPCEYDIAGRNLGRQLDYVNSKGIPYVIFIGPKEAETGKLKIRNMKTGKEEEVDAKNLGDIKSIL